MYLVGFVLMMICSVKNRKRYRVNKLTAVMLTLFTYVFGVAGALAMGKIYSAVSQKIIGEGNSNVAIFGAVIFCPLLLLALFCIQRVFANEKPDFRRQTDLLTPGIFMILACAKFGCLMDGCCYGIEWEHGIYNPKAEMTVFPVQLFEVICMIAVLIAARLIEKSKVFVPGMKYPVTAILYCITRFGWEFFRYYPDERLRYLFLKMSMWQLCCVAVIAVSAAVIVYIRLSQRVPEKAPLNKHK